MSDPSPADAPQFYVPGHFYSPIPNREDVSRAIAATRQPDPMLGIDLRETEQMEFLEKLKTFYGEVPFPEQRAAEFRFAFDNPSYSWCDAIMLFCMLRHLRPRRIIEVGSGFTSGLMLDVNERYFASEIACTFIEPYPDVLLSLLRPHEAKRVSIIPSKLQEVDVSLFQSLGAGDILFIDSSHVVKAGSDVRALFFDVIPSLRRGVVIHFHDIFDLFEYPSEWLEKGLVWNEQYMLRAFLQFNSDFKIKLYTGRMINLHRDWFARWMPDCLRNSGGHIWLERTGELPAVDVSPLVASSARPAESSLLRFRCNICGEHSRIALGDLERETPTCAACGSTARLRSVIRVLSTELFRGESEALPDFPRWKEMTGFGLEDWEGYASRLRETFTYTNTFPDREPKRDLARGIPTEWLGSADFVLASEVIEHIPPPVENAFHNLLTLLKPGGVLVLTVPYSLAPETVEHYPELHDYAIVEKEGERILRNMTTNGAVQEVRNPVFHEGAVPRLEMRIFSQSALLAQLRTAGFTDINVHRKPDIVHGVWWPEPWSLPISARRPASGQSVVELR